MKSSGNKIPQVSLSSVVTNKDLVSFSETESLALADITRSFGYKLKTEEHLSDRSCLTCARNFARSTAVIAKRFSGEIPRMKRGSGQGSEKTTDNSRRSLGLGESPACSRRSDDELCVSPISDEIGSGMNIKAAKQL